MEVDEKRRGLRMRIGKKKKKPVKLFLENQKNHENVLLQTP